MLLSSPQKGEGVGEEEEEESFKNKDTENKGNKETCLGYAIRRQYNRTKTMLESQSLSCSRPTSTRLKQKSCLLPQL